MVCRKGRLSRNPGYHLGLVLTCGRQARLQYERNKQCIRIFPKALFSIVQTLLIIQIFLAVQIICLTFAAILLN